MGYLICLLYGLTGLLLYFVWKSSAFLINGKFEFKTWREKNLHRLIYAFIMLSLVLVVFKVQPQMIDVISNSFGISFDVGNDNPEDASPIVLGFAIASFVYRANKTIAAKKEPIE